MSDFSSIWDQAGKDDWEPPAGFYAVKITEAAAFISQAGKHTLKLRLHVTSGPYTGNEWVDIGGFGSDVAARITRAKLAMFGMDTDAIRDWDQLKLAVDDLVGTRAEVEVKHKDGYVNTNVIRAFTGESDVSSDASTFQPVPAGDDDDDEIPY